MSTEDTQRFLASLQAENTTLLARCEQLEKYVGGELIRSDYRTAADLRAAMEDYRFRCEQAEAKLRKWNTLVASGCTPGGSEFHDDPERTAHHIKERQAGIERIMRDAHKAKREAEATVAACKAAGFVDEKGIDDLARVAFETSWAGFDTVEKWDGQPEGYKENWRRIVRAVLEAQARKGAGDAPR
jgi:hypothetical protein